jgi:hypothetical protein
MPSYNIEGIDGGLDKAHHQITDNAETVQSTVDNPDRNEQDLCSDILDFQSVFSKNELGKRLMLSAVKGNFTVDDVVLQEIK